MEHDDELTNHHSFIRGQKFVDGSFSNSNSPDWDFDSCKDVLELNSLDEYLLLKTRTANVS